MAMHHHVHHTVLLEILRLLEAVWQLFPDGLFDHPRPGEADERTRLSNMYVAQHSVRGGDAAGGRIGEDHDIGSARRPQVLHRDGGPGHLHERQDALLHARPAGCRKQDERRVFLHGRLQPLDDRLAGRHAERAAHEVEILHADDNRKAVELTEPELDRVLLPRLGAGVPQSVGIAPLIAEFQRVGRDLGCCDVYPGFAVEHRFEPRRRAHAHVIIGDRDDELVCLDILVKDELPGVGAFDPQILRHIAAVEKAADLWPDDVGYPVHDATPPLAAAPVAGVALPAALRLSRTFSTRAEPTTTASAPCAMAAALAASRTPKPTATGRSVWRLIRRTASTTKPASGAAAPVMPVIDT